MEHLFGNCWLFWLPKWKDQTSFFPQVCQNPWMCPCPPRFCPQDLVLEFFEIDSQVLNRRTARRCPILQWNTHLHSSTQSAALKRPQHWLSLSSHIPLYICVGCSSVCTCTRMFTAQMYKHLSTTQAGLSALSLFCHSFYNLMNKDQRLLAVLCFNVQRLEPQDWC